MPMGVGHGPAALPIVVAAGGAVSADLTWVSSAVYDHSRCVDVATVSAAVGDGAVHTPLAAHMCGPNADHVARR
jgi:hypothetical protein